MSFSAPAPIAPVVPRYDTTWSIYLTTSDNSGVTDEQLAELDEFQLLSRISPEKIYAHLQSRIAYITYALICASGAVPGRSQMLRSVNMLQSIMDTAVSQPLLLRKTVRGLAALHRESVDLGRVKDAETKFLAPLVNIAVNRVSDKELAGGAAKCLGVLLGCPSLDRGVDDMVSEQICQEADEQTRRLIGVLITEVYHTSSPTALTALSSLLRRDYARLAFCERDGTSTLAWTLGTEPGKGDTGIGEGLAQDTGLGIRAVATAYQAVFSVWMLTFAVGQEVKELVLTSVLSSRLLVVLGRLLNHVNGQRLKIARVTMSSLRNLATGDDVLRMRVRRDLLAAEVPVVLDKLLRMGFGRGSLLGNDEDAMADAFALSELLKTEMTKMSTLDAYVSEVKACALHWSPVHSDTSFWLNYAQKIVEDHREVLSALARVVKAKNAPSEELIIACSDIANIIQASVSGKAALLALDGLKTNLMKLMSSHFDDNVRKAALNCVQLLIMTNRPRLL